MIGEYNQCFGFNFRGDSIMCEEQKYNDFIGNESHLVVFYGNGESEHFFENKEVDIKIAFWSKSEDIIFAAIKSSYQEKEEIISIDIHSKEKNYSF